MDGQGTEIQLPFQSTLKAGIEAVQMKARHSLYASKLKNEASVYIRQG